MDDQSPVGLREAYARALQALREGRIATAERELQALLAVAPGEINSLRLWGVVLLERGHTARAIEALERVTAAAPGFTEARTDLARAYRQDGRLDAAREQLRRVLNAAPTSHQAWLAYGDVLADLEKYPDANFAFDRAQRHDPERLAVERATAALVAEDQATAGQAFRNILKMDASHVAALCGLAATALAANNTRDAERLLRHAARQTSHFPLVQRGLCHTLLAAGRLSEAEVMIRKLLKIEPGNAQNWVALGSVFTRLLRQAEALAAYEEAARLNPHQVSLRLSIGHIQKTLGQRAACERSYHACLSQDPAFGEAYWSLADLKTYVFSDDEHAAMRKLLDDPAAARGNRAQLHFALGRALEQKQSYHESFEHYAAGNALRRLDQPFDIANFEAKSARVMACFDRTFCDRESASGCQQDAPIFIVGLPRSGSTLVEQILASHSCVEGTMELPNILTMVREFDHAGSRGDDYPESVRAASPDVLLGLGRRFLQETRPIRRGLPRFIDKMPNNFSHVGLIHAILPHASIIDVRRHPLDSCFSTFKQHFAEGQSFSYSLDDLGRYYRCYLALMDHWDTVLPGKVLHLCYEELVLDPEANIRRLLAHCDLSYEAACLDFHRTDRPIRTASSEQVRRPLYDTGIGYWKHFSQELEPLRASLGDCLQRFADVGP